MDNNSEKGGEVKTLEDGPPAYSVQPSFSPELFTPQQQRRIMRRIDRRLIPTLGVMYCVSLMDRTNLGAANIAGMSVELSLVGERYVSCF